MSSKSMLTNATRRKSNGLFLNLYEFFLEGEFTDAVMILGERHIHVHKLVLASKSPVLRAMFQTEMSEGLTGAVTVHDTNEEVFREFLCFLYTNKCPNLEKFATEILMCASFYQVEELLELCDSHFATTLNDEKAAEYLLSADRFDRFVLKKSLLLYVKDRIGTITRTPGWKLLLPQFSLLTELALEFPPVPHPWPSCPHPDGNILNVTQKISESTIAWTLGWDCVANAEEFTEIISPVFRASIGETAAKFCLVYEACEEGYTRFSVRLLSCSPTPHLSVNGKFTLRSPDQNRDIANKTHIKWHVPVNPNVVKLVLTLSRTALERSRFSFGTHIKLTFTLTSPMDHFIGPIFALEEPLLLSGERDTDERASMRPPICSKYLDAERFSDVQFDVKGTMFRAHRILLASKSQFFENLFEDDRSVYIFHMQPNDFREILSYVYSDDLPAPDRVDLPMLELACMFQLPELIYYVERNLMRTANLDNAIDYLITAHKLNVTSLKNRVKRLVTFNMSTVAKTNRSWRSLSALPELITELFRELE